LDKHIYLLLFWFRSVWHSAAVIHSPAVAGSSFNYMRVPIKMYTIKDFQDFGVETKRLGKKLLRRCKREDNIEIDMGK
jgi:hypothetical protein